MGLDSIEVVPDSEEVVGTKKAGSPAISSMAGRGLKVVGRGRFVRAFFSWLMGMVLPLEVELQLSRTEIGLEVWNWPCEVSLVEVKLVFFSMVIPPPEKESSTKFESHSS